MENTKINILCSSPCDIIEHIESSKMDFDTPKKRFDIYMKIEWVYWSTQSWNSNFSGLSFEKFCDKHKYYLEKNIPDTYVINWIHTGEYERKKETV